MKQLEAMGYAPQLSNKGNVSVEIGGEGAPLSCVPIYSLISSVDIIVISRFVVFINSIAL